MVNNNVYLWRETRLVLPLHGDLDLQQTHLQPALLALQVFVLFTVCELQQSWSLRADTDTFWSFGTFWSHLGFLLKDHLSQAVCWSIEFISTALSWATCFYLAQNLRLLFHCWYSQTDWAGPHSVKWMAFWTLTTVITVKFSLLNSDVYITCKMLHLHLSVITDFTTGLSFCVLCLQSKPSF